MLRIYENPKAKSTLIALEGLGVNLLTHAVGGHYLAPLIAKITVDLPSVTIYKLSSSALSPIIAIIYLALRLRFIPSFRIKKETFIFLLPGVFLIWILVFLKIHFFGKESYYIKDILNIPIPYLYLNLFLSIIWGPFVEEILFRGYFFESLRESWGDVIALLMSSILFVIPHGLWGAIYFMDNAPIFSATLLGIALIPIFISSIILSYTYIKGGLISAILVHMSANFYDFYLIMR